LLKNPDPQVVGASALALGRIAHPQAIKVMQDTMKQAKEPARSAMVVGLFAAGESLCARKQFKEAVAIYIELLDEKAPETVGKARSALAGLPKTAVDDRVRKALGTPPK
jgi:HEAT repeat protein